MWTTGGYKKHVKPGPYLALKEQNPFLIIPQTTLERRFKFIHVDFLLASYSNLVAHPGLITEPRGY